MLLQLLRGSGTAGLSGMDAANAAPNCWAIQTLVMARPLLAASRGELEALCATANGIAYVDDESNADPRFARNALRHQVMPALAAALSRASRSASPAARSMRSRPSAC